MKKRLSLIFILLIVSSALIFTSYAVNNKKNITAKNKITAEKVQPAKTEEAKPQVKTAEEKPKAEEKTVKKQETKTAAPKPAASAPKPAASAPKPAAKPEANVVFIHAADNKTIKSVYVDFNTKDTDTAFEATKDALEQLGDHPRIKIGGYFNTILGYEERDEGPMSGWLFYVNGVKSTKGSKDYSLKTGDKLVWKFVDDYTKY